MSSSNPDQTLSTNYIPDLDHDFYYAQLALHEKEFLKQQTGISDDETLKALLVTVQAKAYKVSACSALRLERS